MQTLSSGRARPLALPRSTEAQVYLLFAIAMGLTLVGIFIGIMNATLLLHSGVLLLCVIAELAIIFSSRLWMNSSPLNYILFALFPLLSGFTFTPYLLSVLAGYVNGSAILLNAALATVFLSLAAAVFARTTSWDMSSMGRGLFLALLGLLILSILQIFFVSLRSQGSELIISGLGIVLFAFFTAFDLQRIQSMGRAGTNPFLLALSLYLDIFNVFMYILRFMLALSGNRR